MAGYTSRIRVEGATGYATPTGNVTVPLWCGCVFIMSVCSASSLRSAGFITPLISSLFPPFGCFLTFRVFHPSASCYLSVYLFIRLQLPPHTAGVRLQFALISALKFIPVCVCLYLVYLIDLLDVCI